jgi:Family of unknown function (DUF5723)
LIRSTMKSLALACVALSVAARLDAQQANASPAALGMGENFSAVARGYNAVAWNPAALGLSGNPATSAMIGTFQVQGGMSPIALSDVAPYADAVVPDGVKAQWLADIQRDGRQAVAAGADMTWATLQTGRFALQVSSTARAMNDISPGFAELVLFGNVDEEGNAKTLDLSGSAIDMNVHSSIALSYGMPILVRADGSRLAVGVTAKHTVGHGLAVSERATGAATTDPVAIEFAFPIAFSPVVREGESNQLKSGSGFGMDLAVAYERGRLVLAAVAQNVVNSFAWDPTLLEYSPAEVVFDDSESETRFESEPLTSAPASVRERVAGLQFNPSLTLGAMLRSTPRLTLAADARIGSTTGMSTRAPVHIGAGAEYRPLNWLPLQLGGAYVRTAPDRDGVQLTGGLGVQLGGFMLSVSGARRNVANNTENALMITLLSHSFNGGAR